MTEAKHWFWVLMDALIAALVIMVLGVGLPVLVEWGASVTPARTVTVTAEGQTTATPDLAEVTFSVVSTGQNPQTLESNNTDTMNAALQFLASQNIATSDIATTGYDLEPSYNYDNTTQRNYITGYTLTQTVTVKIHDLSAVAAVLGGLTPLGVNQVGSVDFTFNDPNEYLAAARADAMNQAEMKAQQLAAEAGASLGEVVSVSENGVVPLPEPVYAMSSNAAAGIASAPTPDIQPGSQDVTDDVTITYALR